MRGVAADLQNVTETFDEYEAMRVAAAAAQASFIESWDGPCKNLCTHADWRWWIAWPH